MSEPGAEEPPRFTPGFGLVLALGAVFIQLFVLLALQDLTGRMSPARFGIATIVGYGLAFALGAQRIEPPPGQSLGFVPPHPRAWLAALLLVPSLLLVSEVDNVVRALLPPPDEIASELQAERSGLAWAELFVVTSLVLPLTHELFFRGLLQPRLVADWGRARGVGATAALAGLSAFALAGPWGAATRLCDALLLGLLRESAGSIWPSLVLHLAFGVTSGLAALHWFGIAGFDDLSEPHTPLVWLLPAGALTGVGLRLCQSLLRPPEGGEAAQARNDVDL